MSNRQIKVTFKTLTPLWTGDAWGECDELKLTGLIGSLRWWFEVLVRGMGYKACDSTGDNKCQSKRQSEIKSPEDVLDIYRKICPVCYLFGTTGWKSRFQVKIEDNKLEGINKFEVRTRSNKHKVKEKNEYLSRYCNGLFGSFTLIFSFLSDVPDKYICLFVKLLKLLSNYGMIGAKISQGNGVCSIKIESESFDVNTCLDKDFSTIELSKTEKQKNCSDCPKLSNFKFLKINLSFNNKMNLRHIWRKDSNDPKKLNNFDGDINDLWNNKKFLPISFHIRDLLRDLWKSNKYLRHVLMGERGKGARIFVSHGYQVGKNQIELRIIGYDIKDEQWENIKDSLTVKQLNRIFWFNEKDYISNVTLIEEIAGQNLILGGKSS